MANFKTITPSTGRICVWDDATEIIPDTEIYNLVITMRLGNCPPLHALMEHEIERIHCKGIK